MLVRFHRQNRTVRGGRGAEIYCHGYHGFESHPERVFLLLPKKKRRQEGARLFSLLLLHRLTHQVSPCTVLGRGERGPRGHPCAADGHRTGRQGPEWKVVLSLHQSYGTEWTVVGIFYSSALVSISLTSSLTPEHSHSHLLI